MKDWEFEMISKLLGTTDLPVSALTAIDTIMRTGSGVDQATQLAPVRMPPGSGGGAR